VNTMSDPPSTSFVAIVSIPSASKPSGLRGF
jgi:hypothetical protein